MEASDEEKLQDQSVDEGLCVILSCWSQQITVDSQGRKEVGGEQVQEGTDKDSHCHTA